MTIDTLGARGRQPIRMLPIEVVETRIRPIHLGDPGAQAGLS
ncbi:MAG: hypothetical protein ACREMV_15320 [Gemmatimonadales bacterium]